MRAAHLNIKFKLSTFSEPIFVAHFKPSTFYLALALAFHHPLSYQS